MRRFRSKSKESSQDVKKDDTVDSKEIARLRDIVKEVPARFHVSHLLLPPLFDS